MTNPLQIINCNTADSPFVVTCNTWRVYVSCIVTETMRIMIDTNTRIPYQEVVVRVTDSQNTGAAVHVYATPGYTVGGRSYVTISGDGYVLSLLRVGMDYTVFNPSIRYDDAVEPPSRGILAYNNGKVSHIGPGEDGQVLAVALSSRLGVRWVTPASMPVVGHGAPHNSPARNALTVAGHDSGGDLGVDRRGVVIYGSSSGAKLTGDNNTILGYGVARNATSATGNVVVGCDTAPGLLDGSFNVVAGVEADVAGNACGSVVIGHRAASSAHYSNVIGSGSCVTAQYATVIGSGLLNGVRGTTMFGCDGAETFRILDPSVGGYTYRTQTAETTEPDAVLTAEQAVGGRFVFRCEDDCELTLPSGAELDAYSQFSGGLYQGLSFKTLVYCGDVSKIVYFKSGSGCTVRGADFAGVRCVTFIRRGCNAWDAIVH